MVEIFVNSYDAHVLFHVQKQCHSCYYIFSMNITERNVCNTFLLNHCLLFNIFACVLSEWALNLFAALISIEIVVCCCINIKVFILVLELSFIMFSCDLIT